MFLCPQPPDRPLSGFDFGRVPSWPGAGPSGQQQQPQHLLPQPPSVQTQSLHDLLAGVHGYVLNLFLQLIAGRARCRR